jgi:hypothetical protein
MLVLGHVGVLVVSLVAEDELVPAPPSPPVRAGGFYGYRVHAAVCTRTGLPLAWQVRSAREHESLFVAALLDTLRHRGFQPETAALDMGYDNNRVYAECEECNIAPVSRSGKPRK